MSRSIIRMLALPALLLAAGIIIDSCKKNSDDNNSNAAYQPEQHHTGVGPLSGMLDHSRFTMSSIIQVDLDHDVARLPLYKGTYNGSTVWFVRTDVSDSALARQLGLNFAPRLANADFDCPTCIQTVTSTDPVPGNASVAFAGTVDFSPMRELVPGPKAFPPAKAVPGSKAGLGYSDLIRVQGSNVVFNAPIVATGDGPFDVSEAHTNTMDRVVAIDPVNKTVDLQFIRAFSHGKDIFYFSFSATADVSAVVERATVVPGMGGLPFPNDDQNVKGARSSIFAFANGKHGLNDPDVQGLAHNITDNAPGNFSNQNPALFETFRTFGDVRNVLGSFPTLSDPQQRNLYTPLWDLNIPVWSDDAVARGVNYAQTDANTIRQLAASGYLTNDGGAKLGSTNIVVNCPVIGFADSPPATDQAPRPAGF